MDDQASSIKSSKAVLLGKKEKYDPLQRQLMTRSEETIRLGIQQAPRPVYYNFVDSTSSAFRTQSPCTLMKDVYISESVHGRGCSKGMARF